MPKITRQLRWTVYGSCLLLLASAQAAFAGITVTGSDADKKAWDRLVKQCSDASPSIKAMLDKLNNPALGKNITVMLVRNDKNTYVDSWSTNKVDLSDIEDFAKLDPPHVVDQCQVLAHIIGERLYEACNPGSGYNTSHKKGGIGGENDYRRDRGYTDRIVDHTYTNDGKFCHSWTDGVITYDTVPDERTETVVVANIPVTPAGGTVTLTIDTSKPNVDVIQIPSYAGGGQRTLTNYSGSFTVVLEKTADPRYLNVRVQEIDIEAPAVPLFSATSVSKDAAAMKDSGGTEAMVDATALSTGPNHVALNPLGWQAGILNLENGQIWVSYTGAITNDIYTPSNPLPLFSTVTGIFDFATNTVKLHTSAAFLDGEISETLTDW